MQNEDEDEATVVLDFKAMQEDLKSSEDLNEPELEFNIENLIGDTEAPKQSSEGHTYDFNIYLFDYKDDYFSKNFQILGMEQGLGLLNQLDELNKTLTSDPQCLITFYYNQEPKAINQLSAQIRRKFTKARTLIIANKLSPKKAQAHAESKYGADAYLSHPFEAEEFHKVVKEINWE